MWSWFVDTPFPSRTLSATALYHSTAKPEKRSHVAFPKSRMPNLQLDSKTSFFTRGTARAMRFQTFPGPAQACGILSSRSVGEV